MTVAGTRPPGRLGRLLGLAAGLVLSLGALGGRAWAEPALWKIEGPKATVYLFGTIHVLRPGTQWRSPRIDAAIKASDNLRLEIVGADDPATLQPLVLKLGMDRAHPLSSKLDAATRARLDALARSMGLSATMLEPMRPWLAGATLSTLPLIKAGFDPHAGVEQTLTADFTAAGKPISGLETAEQQIHFLADEIPAAELTFLKSSLDDAEKGPAQFDELVSDWKAGDETALEKLANDDIRDQYPDLYRTLIVNRDRAFAGQIAELLKGEGVTFIAVGAAHLTGPDSVQAYLAKMGITAVRQ